MSSANAALVLLIAGLMVLGGTLVAAEVVLNTGQMVSISEPDQMRDLVYADVDRDGDLDIFVVSLLESVLLENENGSLTESWTAGPATAAVFGDLDNDGWLDLVLSRPSGPLEAFDISTGNFSGIPFWNSTERRDFLTLELFDLGNDGDLDLFAGLDGRDLGWFNEDGLSRDANWTSSQSRRTSDLLGIDLDHDGDRDLAAIHDGYHALVYDADGGLIHAFPTWTSAESLSASSAVVGDWDGDGFHDLVVASRLDPVMIWTGATTGMPDSNASSLASLGALGSGDMIDQDLDGDLDFLGAHYHNGLDIADGDTSLQTSSSWNQSLNASRAYFVDLDGDRHTEVVALDHDQGIQVYSNGGSDGTMNWSLLDRAPARILSLETNVTHGSNYSDPTLQLQITPEGTGPLWVFVEVAVSGQQVEWDQSVTPLVSNQFTIPLPGLVLDPILNHSLSLNLHVAGSTATSIVLPVTETHLLQRDDREDPVVPDSSADRVIDPESNIVRIVLVSAIALGVVLLVAALLMEKTRWRIYALAFPLYTKLRREKVLVQEGRQLLYEYIGENAGAHYNLIRSDLGLSNGVLSYHLLVLEREGYISSRKVGHLRKFYPHGEVPKSLLPENERILLEFVAENPGASQAEIVDGTSLSRTQASRNLKRLVDAGKVMAERKGRFICYSMNDNSS